LLVLKVTFPCFRLSTPIPEDFQTNLTREKISYVTKKKKSKNLCNQAGVHIILCKKKQFQINLVDYLSNAESLASKLYMQVLVSPLDNYSPVNKELHKTFNSLANILDVLT